jgi:two-component system chemotaxis response regulator CheB
MAVSEARHGDVLEPGRAWLAPGDFHMVLRRDGSRIVIDLNQHAPVNSCRPSVDPLFESAAAILGSAVLGVMLTGMGQDGLEGSRRIVQARGRVIAQDEATSIVWGMPGLVVKGGLADAVLPLKDIGSEIVRRVNRHGGGLTGSPHGY